MPRLHLGLAFALICSMVITLLSTSSPAAALDSAFERTWARTDRPVLLNDLSRTWMWGPEPFTEEVWEPYQQAPGGQRKVVYYDKTRMEITNPGGDSNSIWYVTNGLLVTEMVTGRLQVGDNSFQSRSPAQVNVAGDADDPNGPTYATFAGLLSAPATPVGAYVDKVVNRAGNVATDPVLATQLVTAAVHVSETNHTVAAPFWDFMTANGQVYENGVYQQASLFPNAFYATGFPIAEAYWSLVRVEGTPKYVLIQCFERRCLTFTPSNPDGWKAEAGNVGRHYHSWRQHDNEPPLPNECQNPSPFSARYHDDGGTIHEFADERFQILWQRADLPVSEGAVARTWTWGPSPYSVGVMEPYVDAPGGQRLVQYFDKGRMELNHPDVADDELLGVTYGTLALDMMLGRIQVGDGAFVDHSDGALQENFAGDPGPSNGPTYATMADLIDAGAHTEGTVINERLAYDGTTWVDIGLASYGVTAAHRVTQGWIDHTVASVFWTHMHACGIVYENGQFKTDRLNSISSDWTGPYGLTGLPVTEAYWTTVLVGGTPREVLVQCFERRCLMYTPGNHPGWQVETPNHGQHYYRWLQSHDE